MTSAGRVWVVGFVAGVVAAGACQGSKTTTPPVTCETFATAEELCDGQGERCAPTWSAVETHQAYCERCAFRVWSAGDCGDYHVLDSMGIDTGARYYYRRDTGALVYAQFVSPPSPHGSCAVVGTAALSAPTGCESTALSPLSGWCPPDAGVPGERVFSCCRHEAASCYFDGVCPATWSEAQALAPSLCEGQTSRTHPELGSCGGDHVFRYWYGTTTPTLPFTLIYDASGALIAGVDETTGRCEFGPAGGLTLTACDSTLASACPDGGAAP